MDKSSIYTNRKMGLDSNVWLIMFAIVIICSGWIGYKKATEESCSNFTIAIKGINSDNVRSANVGEILRFRAMTDGNKKVTWNFDDETAVAEGATVTHIYDKEGTFTITAQINGRCETFRTVYIRKPEVIQDNTLDLVTAETVITGNDAPEAEDAVTYMCNVSAGSYEWSVLNRQEYKSQKDKMAMFKFKLPGSYTIQLKLDNDRSKVYTKTIQVLPSTKLKNDEYLETKRLIPPTYPNAMMQPKATEKPADVPVKITEKPEVKAEETTPKEPVVAKPKKIFFIPNEPFADYLREVTENGKELNFFNQYLNNGGETLVQVNDEKKMIRFSELYQRLKGSKRISIKEVTIDRDANNDVIKINVSYKKRLF